tara:strand:- start:179 stop:403 length:225 start_codon:yes stop_codon:yes gene_type:complete
MEKNMNIDKETALNIHDAIMSKVIHAITLAEMNADNGFQNAEETEENITDIRDYLIRAIGISDKELNEHIKLNP